MSPGKPPESELLWRDPTPEELAVQKPLIRAIWKMSQLTPREKLLYIAIATCVGEDGSAELGYATMADQTGMSLSTVRRCYRSLVAKGFLRVLDA